MLYVYGPLLPIRILEEIEVWKARETEHSVTLKSLSPPLEERYIRLLDDWTAVFAATGQAARELLDASFATDGNGVAVHPAETELLLQTACAQSQEFVRQLQALADTRSAAGGEPQAAELFRRLIQGSQGYLAALGELGTPGRLTGWAASMVPLAQPVPAFAAGQPPGTAFAAPPAAEAQQRLEAPRAEPQTAESREPAAVPIGGHTLPPLPYAYNALEPYIDEKTMKIHHDKHHKSYVDGLNTAELKLAAARKSGDFDLVKHWERELAFNGAGHYLHTIFWNVMSPHGGGRPTGALMDAIESSFGSYDAFKAQFSEAANKVEGGGWAILVWSPRSRRLEILTAEKHQDLSQWDVVPLLPLDVWEHAYYLKHQNNRADYIKDWWKVVNWPYVSQRYESARKLVWEPY
ncbi:Fe-Mn family superoxide dismutase [Paenibacillus sp. NFR01]|uniref:Fe-Mn family superoxide dismutase n=1 Tax=Paenibacillus sp. NFR01 TaxID=1566279 RepID=UPI0008CD93FF|nr:Fe-Mn family superoxide dismutase [Paenibacillus sp. NFR01]SEU29140.1 superoxide dismutase, Fe-Mn family [Paenibacillus sp. NFR01]